MVSLESKETYCAPSWSWASREQKISYMFTSEQSEVWLPLNVFRLVRWDLSPAQSDAMVAVKPRSSITMRGFMKPLVTTAEERGKLHTTFEKGNVLNQIYRRAGAFKSCVGMDWIHYCPKVEVTII